MNDSQPRQPNHKRLLEKAMAQSAHSRSGTGAAATAPPSIDELRSVFPDYTIEELIGQGGMGSVFRATQNNLQRPVAIKILAQDFAKDPELGERFLREARTLATLNHPGIITVHDYGERDGTFFLVTELVDGVNLRQLMELGELSPAEALRIAPQLCTALQFAHERGVVHRDIKPENILIDTNGQVKIADFGLAKVARPGDEVALTRNTAVLGTPHYMAPEQWQGARRVDHRADIYSLGVVIYEMLTGNLPIGNFDPPSQRGGVPHGLDAVVRRALAQQPENRYQHASEVQSDVERQASNLGPDEATTAHPDATLVKGPLVAIATVLLCLVGIGYLIFLHEQGRRTEHGFLRDMAEYRSVTNEVIAQAQAGKPIREPIALPELPDMSFLDSDAAPFAVISIAAACVLLILAFGFQALRQIRNSGGRKRGLHLAIIMAWLVPISAGLALCFAPVAMIRSGDLQVLAGLVVIGAGAYCAVRLILWEIERQRRMLAQQVAMGGGGWIATAFLLAFALFANVAVMPRYLPAPDLRADIHVGETFAADMVGKSREDVIRYVGPPLGITVSNNDETWAYNNQVDQRIEDALVFANDRVISFAEKAIVLRGNRVDLTEPHIGQPIEAFIERYGQPRDRAVGSLTTRFTFDNGLRISTRNGIVVGVRR